MPGPTPALNRSTTEVSVTSAYRIIGTDGGMMMPSAPPDITAPSAKHFSYPAFSSAGCHHRTDGQLERPHRPLQHAGAHARGVRARHEVRAVPGGRQQRAAQDVGHTVHGGAPRCRYHAKGHLRHQVRRAGGGNADARAGGDNQRKRRNVLRAHDAGGADVDAPARHLLQGIGLGAELPGGKTAIFTLPPLSSSAALATRSIWLTQTVFAGATVA